ncbi:hypothetical protein HispidOSU_011011, partial [Sigmodon hispidus]
AVAARGGLGKSPSAAQRREPQPGGPGTSQVGQSSSPGSHCKEPWMERKEETVAKDP